MEHLESDITKYTEAIWQSVLGLEVTKADHVYQPDHLENALASCVHITGEWSGTVTLHCPSTLARKVAGIMFSVPEDEAEIQDIQDALGELANMTGGNLKALFPEPCFLSLPTVAVTNFNLRVPGSELICLMSFSCGNKPFSISVLRKLDTNGAEAN